MYIIIKYNANVISLLGKNENGNYSIRQLTSAKLFSQGLNFIKKINKNNK